MNQKMPFSMKLSLGGLAFFLVVLFAAAAFLYL